MQEEFVMNLKADYILKFLNNLVDFNILKENFDLMVNFMKKNLPRRVHEQSRSRKQRWNLQFPKNIPIVFTNGKQLSSSTFICRWHPRSGFG